MAIWRGTSKNIREKVIQMSSANARISAKVLGFARWKCASRSYFTVLSGWLVHVLTKKSKKKNLVNKGMNCCQMHTGKVISWKMDEIKCLVSAGELLNVGSFLTFLIAWNVQTLPVCWVRPTLEMPKSCVAQSMITWSDETIYGGEVLKSCCLDNTTGDYNISIALDKYKANLPVQAFPHIAVHLRGEGQYVSDKRLGI